jgi:hypothetical protein
MHGLSFAFLMAIRLPSRVRATTNSDPENWQGKKSWLWNLRQMHDGRALWRILSGGRPQGPGMAVTQSSDAMGKQPYRACRDLALLHHGQNSCSVLSPFN